MPNLCGTFVQEAGEELTLEAETPLVWAASAALGGGLDTVRSITVILEPIAVILRQNMSTALTFFLAMVLHPEIQRKAQAEVDAVVGRERLPTISDRASLPYVRSLLTEVFRWHPVAPLGQNLLRYKFLHCSFTFCFRSCTWSNSR